MNPLLLEYFTILFWYIIPCFCAGLVVLFIRFVFKPKDFIYRKILHMWALATVLCFVMPANTWWISLLAILTILLLINVTLLIIERFKFYQLIFVDKSHHEILRMINAYYLIMAGLVLIFFGLMGSEYKYLSVIAVMAWGIGDALAAVIGTQFGKHKYTFINCDRHKTIEGTAAMLISSFIVTFLILFFVFNFSVLRVVTTSLLVATSITLIEAESKNGLDNIFCPLAASFLLYITSL